MRHRQWRTQKSTKRLAVNGLALSHDYRERYFGDTKKRPAHVVLAFPDTSSDVLKLAVCNVATLVVQVIEDSCEVSDSCVVTGCNGGIYLFDDLCRCQIIFDARVRCVE